jgi:hypothetical protein
MDNRLIEGLRAGRRATISTLPGGTSKYPGTSRYTRGSGLYIPASSADKMQDLV